MKRGLLFLVLVLVSVVSAWGAPTEYLDLAFKEQYTFSDGKYSKPCMNGHCSMVFDLSQLGNQSNNSISFLARDENLTVLSTDSIFENFSWEYNTTYHYLNGSVSYNAWEYMAEQDLEDNITNSAVNTTIQGRLTFDLMEDTLEWDLLPIFWYNDTANVTYNQYAIFFTTDVPSQLLWYFPFDDDEGLQGVDEEITNKAFNVSVTNYTTRSFTSSYFANGSQCETFNGSQTCLDMISGQGTLTTVLDDVSQLFQDNDLTMSFWSNHSTATGNFEFINHWTSAGGTRRFEWTRFDNQSLWVRLTGSSANDAFMLPPDYIQSGVWTHYAVRLRNVGGGTIEVMTFRNGTVFSSTNLTVGTVLSDMVCLAEGCAMFDAATFSNTLDFWRGTVDEVRYYNVPLGIDEIQTISGIEPPIIAPTFTQNMQNQTYALNTAHTFTLNFTSTNDVDVATNTSTVTVVADNVSKVVNVTYTPTTRGSEAVNITISNADGSNGTFAVFTHSVVAPTYTESAQNQVYAFGPTHNFTLNLSADFPFSASSNSSNTVTVANNGSNTVSVSYTPSAGGEEIIAFTVSNIDGSDTTTAVYTITAIPPTFIEEVGNRTYTTGDVESFRLNVSADFPFDGSTNSSNAQVVADNVSGTLNVTYTAPVPGEEYLVFTVSNADGSDDTYALYTINAVPEEPSTNGTAVTVNINLNALNSRIDNAFLLAIVMLLFVSAWFTGIPFLAICAGIAGILYATFILTGINTPFALLVAIISGVMAFVMTAQPPRRR